MITFREITKENYMEAIFLKLKPEQTSYVADNARSIAEAAYDPEIPGWSMSRFMIGDQYQGKGYGKRALEAFLNYIKETLKIKELYISVELDNTPALTMYRHIGFKDTKQIQYEFDGIIYREQQMIKIL